MNEYVKAAKNIYTFGVDEFYRDDSTSDHVYARTLAAYNGCHIPITLTVRESEEHLAMFILLVGQYEAG